jgi:long-subunit acyl-CoA synthetase (AMP-forming)
MSVFLRVSQLLLHGRNVFMGYLNMKELTLEAFGGPEGTYYHTGDLGKRDEKGFLYVSGRIKGT